MPSPVTDLLEDLVAGLDAVRAHWYLAGAQAAIIHGAARLTADVDVTVLLPPDTTPSALAGALESHGFVGRFGDAAFLARTRVLPLLHTRSEVPLDVVIGGPGLEEVFLQRRRMHALDDVQVPVASAEDVVIMKVLAGRHKDIDDIHAVVAAQRQRFDVDYVRRTLAALEQALGQSDLRPVFERVWAATA